MVKLMDEANALESILEGDEDAAKILIGRLSEREIGALEDALETMQELILEVKEERESAADFTRATRTILGNNLGA